jgi:hypothetical protein
VPRSPRLIVCDSIAALMTTLQVVIWALGQLQMIALLAILIVRRHYQRLPIFTVFVSGTIASSTFLRLNYTWNGFMIYSVVLAALRFGLALELTRGIFGAFPAAAATARRVMFAILMVTAVIAFLMTSPSATDTKVHAEAVPRLGVTIVWILTTLAGLVLWYRLPLAPLPRAILVGYTPYLLAYTVSLSLLFSAEAQPYRPLIGYINCLAFMLLVAYWMRVAWGTADSSRPQRPRPPALVVVAHQAS